MIRHISARERVTLAAATVAACAALVMLALAMVWRAADLRRIEQLSSQTNAALCSLKSDLERRANVTAGLLEDNPDGIPGFSRADLIVRLQGQQATLNSLKHLNCEGKE